MDNIAIPVQTGPLYHCFNCGAEGATFAACFTPCGSALDPWSPYLWYLKLPCGCKNASRVVRLGDCIAPLAAGNPGGLTSADIPAIQAAVQAIVRVVPPDRQQFDPVTRTIYNLMAGTITPHEAIADLQALIRDPDRPPMRRLPVWLPQVTPAQEANAIHFLPEGA
jgi:hypothetical protein